MAKTVNILLKISRIKSESGNEFKNFMFESLCKKNGIEHEFSMLKTPQQNGVVKRKNKTVQKMARVMLKAMNVRTKFWTEVVTIACYTSN